MRNVKYGEIYYYDFGTHEGSVQNGKRPAVIIQDNRMNEHSPTTLIAAVTSVTKKLYLPSHIVLGEQYGLTIPSMVLLEQIACVNQSDLGEYIGFIDNDRKDNPTVNEYCEKWLLIQKGRLRTTTYTDYEWKVKKYIQKPLGKKYMADVTPDDVNLAILPALSMSESVYRSTQMLYKLIFTAAEDSNVIKKSPCAKLSAKGGKPQKVKHALSDEQVEKLLTAIKDLPPYVFVMIGLYCGLRREEILALQWDCVFLDVPAPFLSVKRAWHTEHNRPVILDELKTNAAKRDIPIPSPLADCLKEVKAKSQSPFVVANRDGEPLSYTQFQRVWKYIVTRSNKERSYVRYVNGQKIKHTVTPVLGEKAPHNDKVVYSLDFQVTPHQLRHTYITNLIYAGVDPKTVQYLAGHENSKITMDIYAKVKYNSPDALSTIVNTAFNSMYTKAE